MDARGKSTEKHLAITGQRRVKARQFVREVNGYVYQCGLTYEAASVMAGVLMQGAELQWYWGLDQGARGWEEVRKR